MELSVLIAATGDNEQAKKITSSMLEKKYIPLFYYEQVLKQVKEIVMNAESDLMIQSFKKQR